MPFDCRNICGFTAVFEIKKLFGLVSVAASRSYEAKAYNLYCRCKSEQERILTEYVEYGMMRLLVYRTQKAGGLGYAEMEMEMGYVSGHTAFVRRTVLRRVPSCPDDRAINGRALSGGDGNGVAGDSTRADAAKAGGDGAAPGAYRGASRRAS